MIGCLTTVRHGLYTSEPSQVRRDAAVGSLEAGRRGMRRARAENGRSFPKSGQTLGVVALVHGAGGAFGVSVGRAKTTRRELRRGRG